eukprot:scaffold7290_cov75-Skeletonema_marinoi.AAC.1
MVNFLPVIPSFTWTGSDTVTYAIEFSGWTSRRGCIELSIEFDSSFSTPLGDSSSDDMLGLLSMRLSSGLMVMDGALARGVINVVRE